MTIEFRINPAVGGISWLREAMENESVLERYT